jgi:hypothetical protein
MSRIIPHGPTPPDPLEELRDEVESLRGELGTLQDTITKDNEWIKSALQEILLELQSESDRDD